MIIHCLDCKSGSVSHTYICTYFIPGYVLHQKGDYSQALQVNQESLQIRRDVLGDDGDIHPDVAASLTHIGLVLLKLELHDVALGALHEAYRIRRQLMDRESDSGTDTDTETTTTTPRTDPKDLAFLLYNIALIYHQQGAHEQALVFYQETSRVERETLGQAHRDLSITFYVSFVCASHDCRLRVVMYVC